MCVLLFGATGLGISGCEAPGPRADRDDWIAVAARPILEMRPDAVWTDCFNRLVERAPESVAYLAEHPDMTQRCAPDDLRVMLHASLLRLLIDPRDAPRLSISCLETTLGVLHFDPKAAGRRIGTPLVAPGRPAPRRWHDLYPADFAHALTAHVNADLDRLLLRRWWRDHRPRIAAHVRRDPLVPQVRWLWPVLSRRYADQWGYMPAASGRARAILCRAAAVEPYLFVGRSDDYNLVRAACVLLGSRAESTVQDRLIALLGSPSPVVSHNARLALLHSPDDDTRRVVERFSRDADADPAPRDAPDRDTFGT